MARFYIDTAIFRDYYEDRKDRFRPLGDFAHRFFQTIEEAGDTMIISDLVVMELMKKYSEEDIERILAPFQYFMYTINVTREAKRIANRLSRERGVPVGDAVHAVLARQENAILISRDKHFTLLMDIVETKKPEEML